MRSVVFFLKLKKSYSSFFSISDFSFPASRNPFITTRITPKIISATTNAIIKYLGDSTFTVFICSVDTEILLGVVVSISEEDEFSGFETGVVVTGVTGGVSAF